MKAASPIADLRGAVNVARPPPAGVVARPPSAGDVTQPPPAVDVARPPPAVVSLFMASRIVCPWQDCGTGVSPVVFRVGNSVSVRQSSLPPRAHRLPRGQFNRYSLVSGGRRGQLAAYENRGRPSRFSRRGAVWLRDSGASQGEKTRNYAELSETARRPKPAGSRGAFNLICVLAVPCGTGFQPGQVMLGRDSQLVPPGVREAFPTGRPRLARAEDAGRDSRGRGTVLFGAPSRPTLGLCRSSARPFCAH